MSIKAGARVKVTNHERRHYGHVGTVIRGVVVESLGITRCLVRFDDGEEDTFRWEPDTELRAVGKGGGGGKGLWAMPKPN